MNTESLGSTLGLAASFSVSRAAEPSATEASEMEDQSHIHHAISYIEFTVANMAESQRFYGAAFDWKFNDYGPEYAGIQGPGGEVGGFRSDAASTSRIRAATNWRSGPRARFGIEKGMPNDLHPGAERYWREQASR